VGFEGGERGEDGGFVGGFFCGEEVRGYGGGERGEGVQVRGVGGWWRRGGGGGFEEWWGRDEGARCVGAGLAEREANAW